MKPVRLVLIGAGAIVFLLLVAWVVVFSSSFQTWAVRKVLASQPSMHATLGSISAGMNRVIAKDLRLEQDGAVLTLPVIEVELPVISAGLRSRVFVSRIVARGWTLDLSKTNAASTSAARPAGTSVPVSAVPASSTPLRMPAASQPDTAAASQAVAQAFSGIFGHLQLPFDFSLGAVQIEGDVIFPEARGRAKVVVSGGGLEAGRDGKFNFSGDASLADNKVNSVNLRGTLIAAMDGPRSFTHIAANLDATATGPSYPNGVKLAAALSAARVPTGEDYSAALIEAERRLADIQAHFPTGGRRLDGTWKITIRDADLVPFMLGAALPAFTVAGEGKFDADSAFAGFHAEGKLDATAERLDVLRAELSTVGAVKLALDFSLGGNAGAITVDRLHAAIAGVQPIATVQSLQLFTVTPATGKFEAADTARPLFDIALQDVPLVWMQGSFKGVEIAGGNLRGALTATAVAGGIALRSQSPFTASGVSLAQSGKPLLREVDFSFNVSADYAPEGWQAELTSFAAKSGSAILLALDAKAGRLAGAGESLKATGKISGDLPALLAQPAAAGMLALGHGDISVDFVASIGTQQALHARIALRNLAADAGVSTEELPVISADLRADIFPDGKIELHAPILLERNGRKSDLALSGTLVRRNGNLSIDAQVTSTNFVVDDAKALTVLQPPAQPPATESTKTPRDALPPWAGIDGSVALALKKVVYSDTLQASDVTGTLRLDGGTLKLEGIRAGLGEGGEAKIDGLVSFDPGAVQHFGLAADLALKEFDPVPLFRAINPDEPATVEGKFDVISKLGGRAATLGELPAGASGEFQLTSKSGNFRGLPVSVVSKVEAAGMIASSVAKLGSLATALTGKGEKAPADVTSKAQAVAELTKSLNPIAYDQLSVVLVRDATRNTVLKDFTLISPELRLTGTGQATHKQGRALLEDALAIEFKLRARGHQGDLLKYLGILEPKADDLGYASCTLPLKVGGTLGKPDTSELNAKIEALVVEKGGVGDMFNRLIGGGR